MSNVIIENTLLVAIANALRTKLSFTETVKVGDIPGKIALLVAGTGSLKSYAENKITAVSADDLYGAKTIRDKAFYGAVNLTSITIPETVSTIGSESFLGCTSLETITIPKTIQSMSARVFAECTALKSVTFEKGFEPIQGSYRLNAIFENCTSLTAVEIPDIATSKNSYTSTFAGCTALKTVKLGKGINRIYKMFDGCTSLEEISIGSDLENIGYNGTGNFPALMSLKKFTCYAVEPPEVKNAVDSSGNLFSSSIESIKVPSASVSAYKGAKYWSNYSNIITAI